MITLPIFQNYQFYYDLFLEDTTYTFEYTWNNIAKTFLCTMKKNSTIIFEKIALVPGIDFLKTSGVGELGKLTLLDTQEFKNDEPLDITEFKNRFQFIYIQKDEL